MIPPCERSFAYWSCRSPVSTASLCCTLPSKSLYVVGVERLDRRAGRVEHRRGHVRRVGPLPPQKADPTRGEQARDGEDEGGPPPASGRGPADDGGGPGRS